jgi:hypothetical protein
MDQSQRRVVAIALMLIAAVLFLFYFAKPCWEWATWNAKEGTLDFGIVKFTNRPPFPGDARGIGLGLILPIVLAAAGRVLGLASRGAKTPAP